MKDIIKSRKLEPFGNKEKAKEKGYEWYKEVVDGFVKAGKLDKPTEKELHEIWKKMTGEEIVTQKTNKNG